MLAEMKFDFMEKQNIIMEFLEQPDLFIDYFYSILEDAAESIVETFASTQISEVADLWTVSFMKL